MAATRGQIAVYDPATGNKPLIDGIVVANTGSNPGSNQALVQSSTVADGGGSANFQSVDSDGNAHVINGRVSSGTAANVPSNTSAVTLIASRAARVGLVVNNQSSSTMYIGLTSGITAGASGTGVLWVLPGGSQWTLPISYSGALYAIWDSSDAYGANTGDF